MRSNALHSVLWLFARLLIVVGLLWVFLASSVGLSGPRHGVVGGLLRDLPGGLAFGVGVLWAVHGNFASTARSLWPHDDHPPVFSLPCMVAGGLLVSVSALVAQAPLDFVASPAWQRVVGGVGLALLFAGWLAAARATRRERSQPVGGVSHHAS